MPELFDRSGRGYLATPRADPRLAAALRRDLETGAWQARNRALLAVDELDLAHRLVIAR